MSTEGGQVFTFSLPGGRLAPLPPVSLRHWRYMQHFKIYLQNLLKLELWLR